MVSLGRALLRHLLVLPTTCAISSWRWLLVRVKLPKGDYSLAGCVALFGLLSYYYFYRAKRIKGKTSDNTTASSQTSNQQPHPHNVPTRTTPSTIIPNNNNNNNNNNIGINNLFGNSGSRGRPHIDHKPPPSSARVNTGFPRLCDLTKRNVVSLSTLSVIIQQKQKEKQEQGVNTEEEMVGMEVLQHLVAKADVYLITRCDEGDTSTYDMVHALLHKNGIFDAGLNPVKHLSCSTIIGKAHIARQLESKIHIDTDEEVINHLLRFTPHVAHIQTNEGPQLSMLGQQPNGAFVAVSLQQLFPK